MHQLTILTIILSIFFQINNDVPVYFEGTLNFQSDTLDYSGRKVVFKPGTKFILNDNFNDEQPLKFVILADIFEIQGDFTLEGIGEPGKQGQNGKDCLNCQGKKVNLYTESLEEFQKKCKSEMASGDLGETGRKGGKGGPGPIVEFHYYKSYSGLSNMKINLYGGNGGSPGKGGKNRIIRYINRDNNEVKICKGGNAGDLGNGPTGSAGSFNLKKIEN